MMADTGAGIIKPRFEWFQSDEWLSLSIFVKNVPGQESVQIQFMGPRSVHVRIQADGKQMFELSLEQLWNEVTDESKLSILKSKVELKLRKRVPGIQWMQLEGSADGSLVSSSMAKSAIAVESAQKPPSYPSSSKKRVDWSVVEKQVDDEKPEGDAALNQLFQQIYRDGDDNLKRAMMKSFVESGGTVLSTNWDEVKKDKVEVKPPDGMEARPTK